MRCDVHVVTTRGIVREYNVRARVCGPVEQNYCGVLYSRTRIAYSRYRYTRADRRLLSRKLIPERRTLRPPRERREGSII